MTQKVFITYSHDDADFKDKIVDRLDEQDLEVKLDERALKIGDELLELFEEIDDSDILIPILSENSVESDWVQEELKIAVKDQIEDRIRIFAVIHEGGKYSDILDDLPTGIQKSLELRQIGRFDTNGFDGAFSNLVENIDQYAPGAEIYDNYLSNNNDNPFRRTRTEYFESSEVIANTFAEPLNTSYSEISNLKPSLIEGGRGSGKTMILKSLQARINILLGGDTKFERSSSDFFGVYCKLTRGSFSTQSDKITNHLDIDVASTIYTDEITVRLLSSLLDEINYCKSEGILDIDRATEKEIVTRLNDQLGMSCSGHTIPDLLECTKSELNTIDEYIQRKILGEEPQYDGLFLDQTDIADLSEIVAGNLPGENINIYYLIDEYEVLKDFQKTVVNTLVKRSEQNMYSFKLASKKPGFSISQTLEDEELEEYNDYNSIDLDYNISDIHERSNFKDMLTEITKNLLSNEGFPEKDVEDILEKRDRFGSKSVEDIDEEIREMRDISKSEWKGLSEEERQTQRDHYGVASWYKILESNEHRQFGGLNDLAMLSSGITRFYLELIGVSFYNAQKDNRAPIQDNGISVQDQTKAAHTVSDYFLEYIHDNISKYGPRIQRLVLDLGDIFEEKLRNHTSEPEAARVSIIDPENLPSEKIDDILDSAEEHSVIQRKSGRGGMRPRSKTERQLMEYTLNRIYAPSLRISPRYRWRTKFEIQDLEELVDSEKRPKKKEELINSVKIGVRDEKQKPMTDFE